MNDDLKIIKKKYSEEFSHLCRDLFPTILEKKGVLSKYILSHFTPSKSLVKDIKSSFNIDNFQNYVMNDLGEEISSYNIDDESPEELLKKVGYKLYECTTEDEIQSFKKYYKQGEELCTFNQNRLKRCYVFFAIKDNVNEIKRENYEKPERQDEYGVSVISIQFTRDSSHILSIKNRYNHKVENPDSTYSNNLDNIILGLTQSFAKYYGLEQRIEKKDLVLPSYIKINNKYIKYSYRIKNNNKIYYICDNNTIYIDGKEYKYDKEKYLFLDYFILNLKEKKLETIDNLGIHDSFYTNMQNIEDIKIIKDDNNKIVIIKNKGSIIKITLNNQSKIISYENNSLEILTPFLVYNNSIEQIKLDNLKEILENALKEKYCLSEFTIPYGVKKISDNAFYQTKIKSLILPDSITYIGKNAFRFSRIMKLKLSNNLTEIDDYAFSSCYISELTIPKSVKKIGANAFSCNNLTKLTLPDTLEEIDSNAFASNNINIVYLSKNTKIKSDSFSIFTKIVINDEVKKCK